MGKTTVKKKHICRYQGLAIALLSIFLLYWAGITFFTHSHVVNGVVIVHSHPFNTEHSHTATSLETIFFLSSVSALQANTFGNHVVALFVLLAIFLVCPCSPALVSFVSEDNLLRGPPSASFSLM